MIPYQSPDVSPFERPLTDDELKNYAEKFSDYRSRAFSLPFINLMDVLPVSDKLFHSAYKIDGKILKNASFLKNYASIRVIEMTK